MTPSSYRRGMVIDTDGYWFVDMGPILDLPDWHVQRESSSYPFPTEHAARGFAETHQLLHPGRKITVRSP